jgi:hypothetical protein
MVEVSDARNKPHCLLNSLHSPSQAPAYEEHHASSCAPVSYRLMQHQQLDSDTGQSGTELCSPFMRRSCLYQYVFRSLSSSLLTRIQKGVLASCLMDVGLTPTV